MAEHPKSHLPQDPEYWEELAWRIRADACAPLALYAAAQDSWYDLLSRRASWLVASSAAAMLLVAFLLPATDSSAAYAWIERSLAPKEIAGTLLVGPEPPGVEALVAHFPPVPDDGRPR